LLAKRANFSKPEWPLDISDLMDLDAVLSAPHAKDIANRAGPAKHPIVF
jgi:hypothetical protein